MFEGKYYCVTGAASGIGRSTAIKLASKGASGLAIGDVNLQGLEETAKECRRLGAQTVLTTKLDVSRAEDVQAWVKHAHDTFGRLDGAANVAGIAAGTGETVIETIEQADWDRTMRINLDGVMYCMRAQLPLLTRPGGAIVNIASTSGRRGLPHSAAYAASKFAVIGLTESAAGEYGTKGIRINSLNPGPILTQIFRDGEAQGLFSAESISKETLMKRMGHPDEVANVLCFLLSDEASYVTGAHWNVDGGYLAC